MIKISIQYPNTTGYRFDMDDYLGRHMPRSIELLSAAPGFREVVVEIGIGGMAAGSPPRHVAACAYVFDTIETFLDAYLPHADELQGDVARYTDITPIVQCSRIVIARRTAP